MNKSTTFWLGKNIKVLIFDSDNTIITYDEDLPNQKVNLMVDLFGQETSVEVGISEIEMA